MSPNRLSCLFRSKDVVPKELQSHTVYQFSCGNCNVTYYGTTERHLSVRSSEHIDVLHLTRKRVKCKRSAVSDHLLLHNHFFSLCGHNSLPSGENAVGISLQ